MVVSGSSYSAQERCEQVRKLWDSMKVRLAKQRNELDVALLKLTEDGPGGEDWRVRVKETRQALVTFVERAQSEWRWRLRTARLEESDWTSGNITKQERAVVEAIMAMPWYIDAERTAVHPGLKPSPPSPPPLEKPIPENTAPTPPFPMKRPISSLPWNERPHGPPLKRSATEPTSVNPMSRPKQTNAVASSSKVTLDDPNTLDFDFAELPPVTGEQRKYLQTHGFFSYVERMRQWAEGESEQQLDDRRRQIFGEVPETEAELDVLADMHQLVFRGVYKQARLRIHEIFRKHISEHAMDSIRASATKESVAARTSMGGPKLEDVAEQVRLETYKEFLEQQIQLDANYKNIVTNPDLNERDRVRMEAEHQRRKGERRQRAEQEVGYRITAEKERLLEIFGSGQRLVRVDELTLDGLRPETVRRETAQTKKSVRFVHA